MMKSRRLFLITAIAVFGVPSLFAQADFSGPWVATVSKADEPVRQFKFNLKQDADNNLTGDAELLAYYGGLPIFDSKIEGDTATFKVRFVYDGTSETFIFKGKKVGDTIEFERTSAEKKNARQTFVAKRPGA